jgi:predicted RNA-binding Zn-ribbon protein involved in translation (DUF1610 family)
MPGLVDDAVERQELHCHACDKYVQFDIDLSLNGNHVFNCPNCGHEHCRVVQNGIITDARWDRRNGPTIQVPTFNLTYSTGSTSALMSQTTYWYGTSMGSQTTGGMMTGYYYMAGGVGT